MCAGFLLKRRDVASTLYLGVSREEGLTAHAWLRAGAFIVTGDNDLHLFAVVSTFA